MMPWNGSGEPRKIAVIGDIILDEYLEGDVQRISPEAPVPVHLVKTTTHTPGGAANSARNIALAGAKVCLFSVWGQDHAAEILKSLLERDRIDTQGVFPDPGRPTVRKTRVTSGSQQVLRLDWEKVHNLSQELSTRIWEAFSSQNFDAVLISDYGKGALSAGFLAKIFQHCKNRHIPVVVDPKGRDFSKYCGCNLMTPNLKEAKEALGLEPDSDNYTGEELGLMLQKKYGLDDVLVTMGSRGMVLIPAGTPGTKVFETPKAREVFDVSGAGDTVAAIMTLCRAAGTENRRAVHLANLAAGIVVEKWGTQPVRESEISEALLAETEENTSGSLAKLSTLENLPEKLRILREKGKKVVFTNGCFDILHAGHLSYLELARSLGDCLVVGVNSDRSVKALKGESRPVVPLPQRMQLLAGMACVDFVVSFDAETPLDLIRRVSPDFLAKGADYKEENIVGADFVKSTGGSVHCIPLKEGLSTTNLINTLKS